MFPIQMGPSKDRNINNNYVSAKAKKREEKKRIGPQCLHGESINYDVTSSTTGPVLVLINSR